MGEAAMPQPRRIGNTKLEGKYIQVRKNATVDRTLVIDDGTTAYTLLGTELYANDTFDANLRACYKFMGATPDTSVRFGSTGATTDGGVIGVYVFRGVDTTTPLDVTTTTATGLNGANADPASITPTTYGTAVVAIFGSAQDTTLVDLADPNGLLNLTQQQQAANTNKIVAGAGWARWTTGALNLAALTASNTNTSNSWAAITVALRPIAIAQTFSTSGIVTDIEINARQTNNGYIASANVGEIIYYSTEDLPASNLFSGEIKGVVLTARTLKGDTGPQKVNGVARITGTDYHKADVTLTDAVDPVSIIWETSPATSVAWTTNEINDLVLGVRSRT